MLRKDEGKKRKADEAASTARFDPITGTVRRPAAAAAWATQFISEVASAAQDAIKHTESVSGAGIDYPAAQQEVPQRTDGNAKDLASNGVVFVGQGCVWEAGSNGSLLQARVFSLRSKEAGELTLIGEDPPVLLTSSDASPTAGSRALAGACVLNQKCGLVQPFVLTQHSSTVQLSALDTSGQAAHPVVTFQLADAQPLACLITEGPTLTIQTGHQSVVVGFKGRDGAGRASCHRPGSTAAPELTEQDDGWHVHEVQLPGQCKQRSMLWAARDSKHGLPGSPQPLVCITMGCSCGAEAGSHDLLQLSYTPEVGWTAERLPQSASAGPTAVCQVPRPAFAALEAGMRAPAPQLALATSAGEVLTLASLRGQQQPHALLRALPVTPAAQPHGVADTLAGADYDTSSAGRVEALLRGSLAEHMQWPQADAPLAQSSNASCKLLGRAALPRAAHRLVFAQDRRACQLLAVCADKEGSLCCLNWPLLRHGPVLTGICNVAADASGLGISIRGQDGWLATGETHKSAVALLYHSATGGAHDMVEGLSRPALLLPLTDRAPAKGEAEAAEGMQSVLGALRRRLQDGCSALQDAEQLHGRKAALIRSSLQLLHTHCRRTFQPPTAAAAGVPAAHAEPPGSQDRPPQHGPATAAGQAATGEGGAIGASALECERLYAVLEGGRCIVRARLKAASGRLDLQSAQLLVLCADWPVRSWPQQAQEAPQETTLEPRRALMRAQEGGSVLLSAVLDSQGLVGACGGAPLNIVAVVPVRGSGSAIIAAHPAVKDAGALRWGSEAQGDCHMQHLGSLTVDWAEMLRSEACSCRARSAEAAAASEPTGSLQANAGVEACLDSAAPGKRTLFSHKDQSAEAGQAQAQASEDGQHSWKRQQASLASGPLLPSGHRPAKLQLCLESRKGSVGDVPKALQTALGMALDWQTDHGARLMTVHSSVVSLSFHGSRHVEATIESADTSSCSLLEQCMRNRGTSECSSCLFAAFYTSMLNMNIARDC
ncbi:g6270 [Coccomyxa elongata]